jgi:hypothetical protein
MNRLHIGYLVGVLIGLAIAQIGQVRLAAVIGIVGLVAVHAIFTWWDQGD